jgi:GNAT superfamily N-acetyltransferase
MEIIKRISTEKDKKFIYELNRIVYRDLVIKQFGKWDEEGQQNYFENKWHRGNYHVVEKNNIKIGVIWYTQHSDHIVLNELQLLPEFQGQGIGTSLMNELFDSYKTIPIRLRVLKLNQARYFYERLGFDIYDETDDFFLMEKTV